MKWQDYKLFFSFLRPHLWKEAMLFLIMIAGTVAGLASPYALKLIIDDYIPAGNVRGIIGLLAGLTVVYGMRLLLGYWSDYLGTWIANRVVHSMKLRLFSNLLQQPYAYFEANNPGDIIQKVNHEVHKIQSFLVGSFLRITNNVLLLVGLSFMLCLLHPGLFLLSLTVFPFSIFFNRYWNKEVKKVVEASSVKEGEVYNYFIDSIRQFKLIKLHQANSFEEKRLNNHLDNLFNLYQRATVLSSLSRNLAMFFVAAGPLLILGVGGYFTIQGALTTGSLVAFIQYMNRLYAPANDLVYFHVDFVKAKVSMQRIMPLLQYTPTPTPTGTLQVPIESLVLKNIAFSHGGTTIIPHLDITFEKGRSYAIAGWNGSGKSTLVKLLCQLYPPQSGELLINGQHNLLHFAPGEWFERIAVVHQEPLLFNDSIRFNILYGLHDVSEADMRQALQDTGMYAFVMEQPAGWDTKIGEGEGQVMLSGGQQQQLALTRALLKKSEVLILDEATSAVDASREANILSCLRKMQHDKIIITISHRLSAVMAMDEVLLLKNGQIAAQGSHEYLLSTNTDYMALFGSQIITHTNEKARLL
ncbi:ABC transporter ATM/ATP-binding cassette subfamily B protein [Chitinophaga skermanii]|uniref:ABC transporter ATM/ATP-binding cassette subfamily B protein n=1 Tax=Chitinophaga skermanii TaxID=331697 RepID=A0A327QWK1_9BACT|nr:ABC transporter ATP-binding protein [Chitinophaga skermanii]RAJ08325.1 ABC transporter ATM/ATP-binding cassette subfamily B protein [Chitinophaga skermanii]